MLHNVLLSGDEPIILIGHISIEKICLNLFNIFLSNVISLYMLSKQIIWTQYIITIEKTSLFNLTPDGSMYLTINIVLSVKLNRIQYQFQFK